MEEFVLKRNKKTDIPYLMNKYNLTKRAVMRGLFYTLSEGQARIEIGQQIKDHETIANRMEKRAGYNAQMAMAWLKYKERIAELKSVRAVIVSYYEADILRVARSIKA